MIYMVFPGPIFISLFSSSWTLIFCAKVRLTHKALQLPFDGLGFCWSRNNEVWLPPSLRITGFCGWFTNPSWKNMRKSNWKSNFAPSFRGEHIWKHHLDESQIAKLGETGDPKRTLQKTESDSIKLRVQWLSRAKSKLQRRASRWMTRSDRRVLTLFHKMLGRHYKMVCREEWSASQNTTFHISIMTLWCSPRLNPPIELWDVTTARYGTKMDGKSHKPPPFQHRNHTPPTPPSSPNDSHRNRGVEIESHLHCKHGPFGCIYHKYQPNVGNKFAWWIFI